MLPKKRKSKIQNLIDKLRGKKPTLKKIMQNNNEDKQKKATPKGCLVLSTNAFCNNPPALQCY